MDNLPQTQKAMPPILGHAFTPRRMGSITNMFSDREWLFLERFLACFNMSQACKEVGIADKTGYRYIKKDHIKKFIAEYREQSAKATGLSMQMVMAKVYDCIEGTMIPTVAQQESMKLAAKILRPEGKGININVNTQVNLAASPYQEMDEKQLADELKSRLSAIEGHLA